MKIISYNINGFKTFVGNGKFKQLLQDISADVFCFQETKTSGNAVLGLVQQVTQDYDVYWNENNIKKGYCGVATLVKKGIPVLGSYLVDFDYNGDKKYTSGRILVVKFETFSLVNVYVVNSGNKDEIRKDFDIKFREFIKTIEGDYLVCGDFNVCYSEKDYWGDWNKRLDTAAGLKRFEIEGIRRFVEETDCMDAFRLTNPKLEIYSWFPAIDKTSVEKRHGWRIDYFFIHMPMSKMQCSIAEGYQGADHSPVYLEFE